jgi:hypothetical protein
MNLFGRPKLDMPAVRQRRLRLDVEGHFVQDAKILEDNFQLGGKIAGELIRA